jgi:hypothetical protein
MLTVAGVPSEISIENIRAKCQSIPILNKIQNLSTFALSIERHQLIMSAHNLFSNHEFRRRQVISEQEVSTIHEFISKMTLLHHYTAWELLQQSQPKGAMIKGSSTLRLFSARKVPSVGARIFETTSLRHGFEVRASEQLKKGLEFVL